MKNRFLLIITLITITVINAQQSQGSLKFFNLTNFQIDSLLTEISKTDMTITDKIRFYSEMFLETPYNLTCTGDGPYALYETQPLVNFKETNCMVYCEHVLALSISDSWDNFFNNLQQIRYKDGIIGMRTRNHYTMADWLPENSWLLIDASHIIGDNKVKTFTRTISHINFFENKGITDLRYVKPDRAIEVSYIPFSELNDCKDKINNGDILALIFADKKDIFSGHMLIAIRKEGNLYIRESAMSKMTTFDTPFEKWLSDFQNSKRYAGLSFMRVKDELNAPGRIILPWEVKQLKK